MTALLRAACHFPGGGFGVRTRTQPTPFVHGFSVMVTVKQQLFVEFHDLSDYLEGGCHAALLFSLRCAIREYKVCILSTNSYRMEGRQIHQTSGRPNYSGKGHSQYVFVSYEQPKTKRIGLSDQFGNADSVFV